MTRLPAHIVSNAKELTQLQAKAAKYRQRLLSFRRNSFGKVVVFKGGERPIGIVVHDKECPPHQLPVMDAALRVWWRPITHLEFVRESAYPEWTKHPEMRRAISMHRPL